MDRDEFVKFRDLIAYDEIDARNIDDKLNAGYKFKTIFGIVEREE